MNNVISVTLTPGKTDFDNWLDLGCCEGQPRFSSFWCECSTEGFERSRPTSVIGAYLFSDGFPGAYSLFQINPSGYDSDVSNYDTSSDGDAPDSVTPIDSSIGVVYLPGENDNNNDFVDSDNGSIFGTVTEDQGMPLVGVTLTLTTSVGVTVATTATDSNGAYIFSNMEPGAYFVVETNPVAFPSNVKDEGSTPDGDSGNSNKA